MREQTSIASISSIQRSILYTQYTNYIYIILFYSLLLRTTNYTYITTLYHHADLGDAPVDYIHSFSPSSSSSSFRLLFIFLFYSSVSLFLDSAKSTVYSYHFQLLFVIIVLPVANYH